MPPDGEGDSKRRGDEILWPTSLKNVGHPSTLSVQAAEVSRAVGQVANLCYEEIQEGTQVENLCYLRTCAT